MTKSEWIIIACSAILTLLLGAGMLGYGNPLLAAWNAIQTAVQSIGSALMLILIAGLYLLPTIVAWVNKHHNTTAIAVLNLLLGWTGLGWIGALVWAVMRPPPRDPPA